MSVDSMDAVKNGFRLVGEEVEGVVEEILSRLDLMVSLLSISLMEEESEILDNAINLYDEVLFSIREKIPQESSGVIGYPLVDALELTDCLGPDAIYEILAYAINTLYGLPVETPVKLIEVFTDCLGWATEPTRLPPTIVAGGILASFTGSLNKALIGK